MSEFAQHIQDIFKSLGSIELRRMFGGHGVYLDGIMFGLISDGTLYLKADAENVAEFRAQGLPQFEYHRQGKIARLSYYQAPDTVMEGRDEAIRWARRSFEAALRGKAVELKRTLRRRQNEQASRLRIADPSRSNQD